MVDILINADDFGLNESCTEAICKAFLEGLITDTTMVANGMAFDKAIKYIEKYELEGRVGIHFNVTEGKPLTTDIGKEATFCENGRFHGKINRLKMLSYAEKKALYKELTAQIMRIEAAGVKITHADSHHHIHTGVFVFPTFARVCKEHNINKVRIHRNVGNISFIKKHIKWAYNIGIRFMGFRTTRYFGSMDDVRKRGVLNNMEIMVHPEFDNDHILIDKIKEAKGCAIGRELTLPDGKLCLRGYRDL